MEDKEGLLLELQLQMNVAQKYIERSVVLEEKSVHGASKLTKKIRAELKFLNELKEGHIPVKACHLNSTNLSHLGAVLDVAEDFDIIAVLKPFSWYKSENVDISSVIIVDIVISQGWIKVIARNPIALHRTWEGEGNFGDKSIDKQAKEYISASQQNTINYSVPKVTFIFTQGITEKLAECLLDAGVIVKGNILPNPGSDSITNPSILADRNEKDEPLAFKCNKVNLDVTAMIALVSALTNGSCFYKFQEQILTDQTERERMNPLLPQLNKFLEGKELYACSLAISSFQTILDTLGGPKEKQRARELLSKVKEVCNEPSSRAHQLTPSARIKPRPKIVFGTGDMLQAVTVSSNGSFVRAAKEQGVEFSVFVHEPRALTESKERFGTLIKDEK